MLVPRPLFDLLLYSELTKRELKVLLLVARLTYGCRNAPWVRLRPMDLAAIGISANNARVSLKPLIAKGLLVQNGAENEYRIHAQGREDVTTEDDTRHEHLWNLIREQLRRSSQFENPGSQNEETNALEMRTDPLSKQEPFPSQNENVSASSRWRFCPTRHRFVPVDEAGIDT